jgi:hypothetical protein
MAKKIDVAEGYEAVIVLVPSDFCDTEYLDVIMYNDHNEMFEGRIPRLQPGVEVYVPEGTPRLGPKLH